MNLKHAKHHTFIGDSAQAVELRRFSDLRIRLVKAVRINPKD